MSKVQFPSFRLAGKQTKPGTRPNDAGGNKLVNVTDGTEVRRVKKSDAEKLVAQGWKYAPKSALKA